MKKYETDMKISFTSSCKVVKLYKKVNIFHCVFLRVHKMLVIILVSLFFH